MQVSMVAFIELSFMIQFTRSTIPHQINDSIWLKGGSLLVGAGHLMFLYGQPPTIGDSSEEGLFEHVARHNGPLAEYHPQMLLQCLLWGVSLACLTSGHGLTLVQKRSNLPRISSPI